MTDTKGEYTEEEYESIVNDYIIDMITAYKVAGYGKLIERLTEKYDVPASQKDFEVLAFKDGSGVAQIIDEFHRPDTIKDEFELLTGDVFKFGRTFKVSERSILMALDTKGKKINAIKNASETALRALDRRYAINLVTAAKTGWGNGADAPDYAGRTFANHSHIATLSNTDYTNWFEAIVAATGHINEHGYSADTIFMPIQVSNELKFYLSANNAASLLQAGQVEGSIGRLNGVELIESQWVEDGHILVLDSKEKPVAFGIRMDVDAFGEYIKKYHEYDGQVEADFGFLTAKKWAGGYFAYTKP